MYHRIALLLGLYDVIVQFSSRLPIHDFSVTVTSGPNFGSRIALNPRTAPTETPPNPPIANEAKILNRLNKEKSIIPPANISSTIN